MGSGASIRFDWWPALRCVAAAGLCVLLAACSGATYSGPEWSARVVDTETGAPIEGAIVVVRWELERYSGRFAGWLFITEAVTDADGMFHLPAWGPVKAPSVSGMETRMSPNLPQLDIFKPGYMLVKTSCCSDSSYLNSYWNYGSGPSIRESWANGKTFALEPFPGTLQAYRDYLDGSLSLAGPFCAYQQIPRMYAAAISENQRLTVALGQGIPHFTLDDLQSHRDPARCSETLRTVVERYSQ